MSLRTRSALSLLGVLLQGAARFLTTLLVKHLAGIAVVGGVSGGLSLATLASLGWPTSAGMAAGKFVPRESGAGREDQAAAVAAHLARRTLASMLVIVPAAALYAAHAYGWGWQRLACLTVLVLGFSGYSLVRGLQMGRGAVGTATVWEGLSAAVSLGLLVVVLRGGRHDLLLLPMGLGYGLYAAAGWPRNHPPVDPDLARESDAFVAWGIVGTLASTGLLQLTMVVCSTALSAREAGAYGIALSLATPASMIARSFSMVLFPTMARAVGAGDESSVRTQTDRATRGLAVTMIPLFGAVCLLAEPVLRLLYGADAVTAAPLVSVLTIATLATTLNIAAVNALSASSRDGIRSAALMSAVGFAAGCLGMLLLAGPGRALGIACAYLVGSSIIGALPLVLMARRQGQRWTGLLLRVVACCAVVLGGALWAQGHGIGRLAIAVLAAVAAWGALLGVPERAVIGGLRR